jgi:hypothetical protein
MAVEVPVSGRNAPGPAIARMLLAFSPETPTPMYSVELPSA